MTGQGGPPFGAGLLHKGSKQGQGSVMIAHSVAWCVVAVVVLVIDFVVYRQSKGGR